MTLHVSFAWLLAAASLGFGGCSSGGGLVSGGGGWGTGGASTACDPGDTRACVGPGSCAGGQLCQADGTWSACDCGLQGGGGATTGGVGASTGGSAVVSTGGRQTGGTGGSAIQATGGTVPMPTYLFTFTDASEVALALPANTTPPANDLTQSSVFSWDGQNGAPDPVAHAGSLRIDAPFSAYTQPDQSVDFQFMLRSAPVDLTGKTLFVYLKLDSGFSPDPSAPGGLIFYAKSGMNWDWGQAPWLNLDPTVVGQWRKYVFNLSTAESGATNIAPFDPSQVMSIGIKLDTGSPTITPLPAPPAPAVFHIDSIGYQ
jgi:hypothetical protein